jgi:hypothetical protein
MVHIDNHYGVSIGGEQPFALFYSPFQRVTGVWHLCIQQVGATATYLCIALSSRLGTVGTINLRRLLQVAKMSTMFGVVDDRDALCPGCKTLPTVDQLMDHHHMIHDCSKGILSCKCPFCVWLVVKEPLGDGTQVR